MDYNAAMGNDSQLLTLANSGLPPRVSGVLRRLLDLTHAELFPRIDPMLDQLDGELYRSAEKSRNPSEQLDLLRASQVLREKRSIFAPEFFRQLESQLAGIRRKPQQQTQKNTQDPLGASIDWMLEDTPKTDTSAQLRERAMPLEGASSLPLYLMGQRFGVLAASPAFTSAELPLGPQQFLEAATASSQSVFGEHIQLQQLLGFFTRHVLGDYPRYLEKVSRALEDAGILPGLSFVPARPAKAARPAFTPSTAAPAPEPEPAPADTAPAPTLPPSFSPAGLAPVAAPVQQLPLSWLDQPTAESLPSTHSPVPDFRQLQQLLSAHRFASRNPLASRPVAATSLSNKQVEDLLGQLAGQTLSSIEDWRETLQQQIRIRFGEGIGLSRENSDSIELLSLLMQQINQEVHDGSLVHDLLQHLQRPLLHTVMSGHEFFEDAEHPARQLLNTIAEYDNEARNEQGADPAFEALIRQVVEQLEHNQHPDKTAFDQANQQLLAQLQQQIKRAQASEKRCIESMKGRERMATAKNIASDALEARLKDLPLPPSLQILLRNAWLDALTLALLRYGVPSQGWSSHLARTEQILKILREEEPTSSPELAREVESALRRVGYHDDDASAVAKQLSRSQTAPAEAGEASSAEVADRIQQHTRFGTDDSHEPSITPDIHTARNALEDAYYQQLCSLPFGTWFDFVEEDGKEVSRRRLSWYSQVTEHALFVNRRGQKTAVIHLDTLAKMMAEEKVRLTERNQIRLVDRALSSAANVLQRLIRSNKPTQPSLPA